MQYQSNGAKLGAAAGFAAAAAALQMAEAVMEGNARSKAPLPQRCDNGNYGCYSTGVQRPPVQADVTPSFVSVAEARDYTLRYINGVRRLNGVGPIQLDDALNAFAQAGSEELAQDHRPLQHFIEHQGELGVAAGAENQGASDGAPPGPIEDQIGEILGAMMREGRGGAHHDTMLAPDWNKLGVGIVGPGERMYLTMDFTR
jgi:uncharacterized protein YkwD